MVARDYPIILIATLHAFIDQKCNCANMLANCVAIEVLQGTFPNHVNQVTLVYVFLCYESIRYQAIMIQPSTIRIIKIAVKSDVKTGRI